MIIGWIRYAPNVSRPNGIHTVQDKNLFTIPVNKSMVANQEPSLIVSYRGMLSDVSSDRNTFELD